MNISLSRRSGAEVLGTFWLVFGGCGSALLAAAFPQLGIGFHGVSLAFGLTVLTMAYAIGHVSGCHLNPAVTLGLVVAKRFPAKEIAAYWAAQIVGALLAAGALAVIVTGKSGGAIGTFASNGYGASSPAGYGVSAAFLVEFITTFFFLFIILGATDKRAPSGFAPIAIGLGLTLIHLISIPVTNTSVNPARSLSQALFAGGPAVGQLWLFWVAPLLGAVAAGVLYPLLCGGAEHERGENTPEA